MRSKILLDCKQYCTDFSDEPAASVSFSAWPLESLIVDGRWTWTTTMVATKITRTTINRLRPAAAAALYGQTDAERATQDAY